MPRDSLRCILTYFLTTRLSRGYVLQSHWNWNGFREIANENRGMPNDIFEWNVAKFIIQRSLNCRSEGILQILLIVSRSTFVMTYYLILHNSTTHDGAIKSALNSNMTLLYALKWKYASNKSFYKGLYGSYDNMWKFWVPLLKNLFKFLKCFSNHPFKFPIPKTFLNTTHEHLSALLDSATTKMPSNFAMNATSTWRLSWVNVSTRLKLRHSIKS